MANTCCPVGYTYNTVTQECVGDMPPYETTSPIECPCCPEGYIYKNTYLPPLWPNGFCIPDRPNVSNLEAVSTIPCIDCNCSDYEPVGCADCGSGGIHIAFDSDPTVKQCTDCEPVDENNPPGKIQSFLNPLYLDPVIANFKLRNKNFI